MMSEDAVNFLLLWLCQLIENNRGDWKQGIVSLINLANDVIDNHNAAVEEWGGGGLYWHETSKYSDNQCVFSGFLRRDTKYGKIAFPWPHVNPHRIVWHTN